MSTIGDEEEEKHRFFYIFISVFLDCLFPLFRFVTLGWLLAWL